MKVRVRQKLMQNKCYIFDWSWHILRFERVIYSEILASCIWAFAKHFNTASKRVNEKLNIKHSSSTIQYNRFESCFKILSNYMK